MKYGPWIIWNATEDSVCPVPAGTMGQVQFWSETRGEAQSAWPVDLNDKYVWSTLGKG